jgi:TRAP transporter TAXI family solute receptor
MLRRVRKQMLPAFALVMAASASSCDRPEATQKPRRAVVRLSSGPLGGGFFPLGEQVAGALGALMPDVEIETIASSGAVSNIEAVQRGDADLGFTFADVAYIAFSGQLDDNPVPFDRLRGIAVLQLTPISLVARADAPIKTPADLRGRRVAIGPFGSGTALTANLILHAFGLDPPAVHVETISFQDAATRVLNGTLDAMFDNAISQSDSLKRVTEGGARPVPIEGPPVDRLRRDYPFLKVTVIPREMYPTRDRAVHTIGVDGLLICRRDLDEGLVYELTKQLFRSLQSLSTSGALGLMDLDQAPATPIPLHDGAARYYRERELSR